MRIYIDFECRLYSYLDRITICFFNKMNLTLEKNQSSKKNYLSLDLVDWSVLNVCCTIQKLFLQYYMTVEFRIKLITATAFGVVMGVECGR